MRPRVLVVGIDGVRWDTVHQVSTPALDAVAAAGFRAPVTVNAAGPTISGPCWATMATGVLPTAHGILGNELPSPDLPADFLALATRAGLASLAAAAWPPLVRPVDCGPVFAEVGTIIAPPDPGDDPQRWDAADQFVADASAAALAEGATDIAFIYFGLADEVAHAVGVGGPYHAAIEACDRRLGAVLDAAGALRANSDWTVIVATDHGHVDAGGHGGDSEAERTAWIAACGPDIAPAAPPHLEQADIFAVALTRLGIDPPPGRFGIPFGARGRSQG